MRTRLCIIAVKFEDKYYSIRCFYDGETDVASLLTSRQNSETSAVRFVSMGDVELSKKNGFLVPENGSETQHHRSPLKLVTYALELGSENFHLFENGAWTKMPLLSEELEIDLI